jgi:parallel beta-helix repeat protein
MCQITENSWKAKALGTHRILAVVFALILICLMASGTVCVRPIKAQSQGDITINADGSVNPSTAPVQQAGNTYTLTSDAHGSITVGRNNTVLDGNGYLVSGSTSYGYSIIQLYSVENVTIENLIINGGILQYQFGIDMEAASEVTVVNNTITGFENIQSMNGFEYAGIIVDGGGSNIISQNNLVGNLHGIDMFGTEDNLIVGNNITGDNFVADSTAIFFGEASNNTVYHNNFINNKAFLYLGAQAEDYGSVNVWDNGYPSGGNYWSEYQTRYSGARQIGSSGVGDTPYVIDAHNKDRYPLMAPFNSAFYALQTAPPKVSVQSPLNQTYNDSSVPLTFSVNVLSPVKTVNWTGYSLDGEPNVTVTGSGALTNVTLADVANGVHNVTVYANDTYGNMGASQTIDFIVEVPEVTEPFPTALVATVSGASAAAACLGLLVYFKKRKH